MEERARGGAEHGVRWCSFTRSPRAGHLLFRQGCAHFRSRRRWRGVGLIRQRVNAMAPGPVDNRHDAQQPESSERSHMICGTLMKLLAQWPTIWSVPRCCCVFSEPAQVVFHHRPGRHRRRRRYAALARCGATPLLPRVISRRGPRIWLRSRLQRLPPGLAPRGLPPHLLGIFEPELAVAAQGFGDRPCVVDRLPSDRPHTSRTAPSAHEPSRVRISPKLPGSDHSRTCSSAYFRSLPSPRLMNCVQNLADFRSDAIRMSEASARAKQPRTPVR